MSGGVGSMSVPTLYGISARDAAWDAARAAARRTLAPVVEKLQASAFELLDRMLALPKVQQ